MQCKDIPDDLFLAAVADTLPMNPGADCWRDRHDVYTTLAGMLGTELPVKLLLAKARRLGRRQLLEGCTDCTCRGDYHLPRECRRYRCCYHEGFDWRTHPGYDPSWEADPPRPPYDPAVFSEALAGALAAVSNRISGGSPFDLSAPARLTYPAGRNIR